LRAANGGEAKGGRGQTGEIVEDRVMFEVWSLRLEVGGWMSSLRSRLWREKQDTGYWMF